MWKLKEFKKKLDSKIKDFAFQNSRIRLFRSYINNVLLPYFVKFIFSFIVLLILVFFGLKMFKPDFLDKIYFKASSYVQNNFNLDEYDFSSIEIKGLDRSEEKDVMEIVRQTQKNFDQKSHKSLIKEISQNIKNKQKWVDKISVFRSLPNRLNIVIVEYEPFAIWHDKENIFAVDRDGNKVKIDDESKFSHLIVLSGKDAFLNVKTLFNILAVSPEISSKVYSAVWVGSRRWDVRFEDGLLVKLPAAEIEESWQKLIMLYNKKGALHNLKTIDLRIDKKTYLEYKTN